MKNKILTCLLILFLSKFNAFSQYSCSLDESMLKSASLLVGSSRYIPDASTPVKYVRVNIHFMQYESSNASYPGNFSKTDDGNGNSNYTGYDYAQDMINKANAMLSANMKMNLPPGNSTPVLGTKYRLVLNAVFFNEDDFFHKYKQGDPHYTFKENASQCINVYLTEEANPMGGGGHATPVTGTGERRVYMYGCWGRYHWDLGQSSDERWGLDVNSKTLIHESGHNLGLYHTVRKGDGECANVDDYCSDTPSRQYMIDNYGHDPCCGWVTDMPNCTNNMMDYEPYWALTPEQLGRIHNIINNYIYNYQTCRYINSNENITSFTDNKSYIAETVSVPSGNSVVVDEHSALYVNAEEFEVNGELEIKAGSTLDVRIVPNCY